MYLKIENLRKVFEQNVVLNDISLTVNEREITVLMGPSGCGKTTLLRCLCDLETADKGTIQINDRYLLKTENGNVIYADKKTKDMMRKEVGFVFQNFHLFPHRTILQNIIDPLLYHKIMSKNDAIKRAEELLRKLAIFDKKDQYPYMLSGGQKQRAAIARACILKPSILCFDEPTSALDNESIQQVIEIIKDLSKDMAILIITHDESFARNVGTNIIDMQKINKIERASDHSI